MIYFNFSNSLDKNLLALYEKIKENRKNFFDEFKIIISSLNYKKCIEEYFLLRENVCFNISFDFLEPFFSKIFLDILGYDEKDVIILTLERNKIILTSLVFSILKDKSFREKHKSVFDVILYNEKNTLYETTLLWRLSETITDFLREYEYHRYEEIILNWKNGKNAYNSPEEDYIEAFEKDIYKIIFIEKRFFKDLKKNYFSITELFEKVITTENLDSSLLKTKYNNIFLFGFPQFSKLHLKMIEFIEKYVDIYLYSPNYLRLDYKNFPYSLVEENNVEKFVFEPDFHHIDEFLYPVIATNYLLKDKISDENLNFEWKEIENNDVLNTLKRLFMTKKRPEERIEEDDSLQIFSATSRENEVFAIYNSILYNMEVDKDLLFDDILVIVPDIKNYRTILTDIFGKNPYHSHPEIKKNVKIPFQIYEKNVFKDSNFNKIISDFFDLIENNFSKFNLLKIIENPLLMKKFNIEENELVIFRKWIEELGAFDEDDYFLISKMEHSLKRLKFGMIMEKKSPVENFVYENILPYYDSYSDIKKTDTFISITERLYELFKSSSEEKTLSQWIDFIKDFINEFIDTEDFVEENQLKIFYMRNLNLLLELEMLIQNKFKFEEIKFHFLNLMSDIIDKKGSGLFNGVCVSSFLPMRAIPFKIIYILGMNEGDFPSPEDKSTLNLRNIKILYNDISKRRLDNFLFLEAIFSAEKKVYISYIGYDPVEDCELFPSSTLYNLIEILNKDILKKNYEIKKLPKSPISDKLLNKVDLFTNIYFTPYRILSYKRGSELPVEKTLSETFKDKEVNIRSLAEFIQNPIEEMIKKKTGVYEPDITTEFITTRKIDLQTYLKVKMLNMALKLYFKEKNNFKSSLEKVYDYFYFSGKTTEIRELKNIEINSFNFIEDILKPLPLEKYFESIVIGNEYENKDKRIYPPLEIEGINITGKLENVFIVDNKIMWLIFKNKKYKSNEIKTDKNYILLKLFLSFLSLIDKSIKGAILKIINLKDKKDEDIDLNPLEEEDLKKIVNYYKADENFHFLPLDVIIDNTLDKQSLLKKIIEKENDDYSYLRLSTPLAIQRKYDDFIPDDDNLKESIKILLKIVE